MVQGFYDGTADLEAKFKQTYWNPTYGEAKDTSGKLKLKKPGKMVWDYGDGQDADYYANGDTLWMVEHDTRQVIKTSVDGNSEVNVALKFLFGGEKLTREFQVRYAKNDKLERYGDADHYVLELKPKAKNKHYKGMVLMVHATTGRVDSFVVYNTDGSSNYFQLRGIKTNVGDQRQAVRLQAARWLRRDRRIGWTIQSVAIRPFPRIRAVLFSARASSRWSTWPGDQRAAEARLGAHVDRSCMRRLTRGVRLRRLFAPSGPCYPPPTRPDDPATRLNAMTLPMNNDLLGKLSIVGVALLLSIPTACKPSRG